MKTKVKIKKLTPLAQIPKYATSGSAASDLICASDTPVTIQPGESVLVPTGLAIAMDSDKCALVFARSGLAVKNGITLANSVGVIDSDYRGEVKVGLRNLSKNAFTVNPGDRIAQLMFVPVCIADFCECTLLDETERGEGGFGSTGI